MTNSNEELSSDQIKIRWDAIIAFSKINSVILPTASLSSLVACVLAIGALGDKLGYGVYYFSFLLIPFIWLFYRSLKTPELIIDTYARESTHSEFEELSKKVRHREESTRLWLLWLWVFILCLPPLYIGVRSFLDCYRYYVW